MGFLISHPTLVLLQEGASTNNLRCNPKLVGVEAPARRSSSNESGRELQWRGNAPGESFAARQNPCFSDSSGQYLPH
jgi:hypothetical protein